MQEVLRLRDPGAPASPAAGERALGLDRALIIEDFLRLKATQAGQLPDSVRDIDERLLRILRDNGHLTSEVCAIVRYMRQYYADRAGTLVARDEASPALPPVSSGPPAAAAPQPAPAAAADPAVPASPRPRPSRTASAAPQAERLDAAPKPRPAPAARPAPSTPPKPAPTPEPAEPPSELELAQAARAPRAPEPTVPADVSAAAPAALEPPVQLASVEPPKAPAPDPELRRTALHLIADLEAQLKVPPYLTFRDARTSVPPVPTDELETRREASLRAVGRLVALLTTMNADPALREAVQAELGPAGRLRVRQGMDRSLKNVPDATQRQRAERLWSQLVATARK